MERKLGSLMKQSIALQSWQYPKHMAHKKAVAANLFAGSARSHHGNLAACLRVEKIYAMPVIFSGPGSLVLSKAEVRMIEQHYMNIIRNIFH